MSGSRKQQQTFLDACRSGDAGLVRRLLDEARKSEKKDAHALDILHDSDGRGNTPLIIASIYGHDAIVRTLIDLPIGDAVNVNAAGTGDGNEEPLTSLMWACRKGHVAVARMLLESRALDLEAVSPKTKRTAIFYACEGGSPEVVELLLTNNSDVTQLDSAKKRPEDYLPKDSEHSARLKQTIEKRRSSEKNGWDILSDSRKPADYFSYDPDSEPIGRGTYGIVYSGKCMGESVAIKVLISQPRNETELQHLRKELRFLASFRHSNVMSLHHYCEKPFMFATPKANGSLLDHLKKAGWPDHEACRLLREVANGMAYIHDRGVVHGDLKPENILVDRGQAVITDFGLSVMRDPASVTMPTRTFRGTLTYSAPEVINGKRPRAKSDVYSFGVICWEVMSQGSVPYGTTNMDWIFSCKMDEKRPCQPMPLAPSQVVDIINDCWLREPKDRPEFTRISAILEPLGVNRGARIENSSNLLKRKGRSGDDDFVSPEPKILKSAAETKSTSKDVDLKLEATPTSPRSPTRVDRTRNLKSIATATPTPTPMPMPMSGGFLAGFNSRLNQVTETYSRTPSTPTPVEPHRPPAAALLQTHSTHDGVFAIPEHVSKKRHSGHLLEHQRTPTAPTLFGPRVPEPAVHAPEKLSPAQMRQYNSLPRGFRMPSSEHSTPVGNRKELAKGDSQKTW